MRHFRLAGQRWAGPGRTSRILPVAATAILVLLNLMAAGCGKKPDPRPNIVLVVLDTVRDDFAGGTSRTSHTPHLDRLATAGTTFENAWANAPWTVPSHASLFTGLLPSGHGCTSRHAKLDAEQPTLAELLTQAGYQTAAFFSNPWLSDRATELLRGFDVRQETRLRGFFSGETRYPDGDQGGRASAARLDSWLQERKPDVPFFLFVNFLEAHLPYDPPADYRQARLPDLAGDDWVPVGWGHDFNAGLLTASQVNWTRIERLYAGDVNTADRLLSSLLTVLRREGLYQNSVIIVTSDHGENLGDHGLAEHQFSVHETLLAVPLVIHAPGLVGTGVREDPAMLLDLYATILDLAGLEKVAVPGLSRSLVAEPDSAAMAELAARPLVAEYAGPPDGLLDLLGQLNPDRDSSSLGQPLRTLRVGDLRLTASGEGSVQLHDLAKDPHQARDVSEQRPRDATVLLGVLDVLAPAEGLMAGEPVELDAATRQQLRALGYVH